MAQGAGAERTVLLTGATGVLGTELTCALLADPATKVWLLLRARSASDLQERARPIVDYARRSGAPDVDARVTAVRGDVTLPELGLSPAEYAEIAREATHVIHAAADVRFDQPIEEARRTAVFGLQNVVRLARERGTGGTAKKVDYVSTVGVAGRQRGLVLEEPQPVDRFGFRNSYEQSKAEAEQWLLSEMARGDVVATIHRPTMIVGHSLTGHVRSYYGFYFLVDYFLGMKNDRVVPDCGDVRMDTVPVDYVASAIAHSTRASRLDGKILHLCSGPMAFGIADVVAHARAMLVARGVDVPQVTALPLEEYLRYLAAKRRESGSRLYEALEQFAPYFGDRIDFDNRQAAALLGEGGIEVPPVERYLGVVLDAYFRRTGR